MSLDCPHCHRQIEFVGTPPKFCGYCGQLLGAGSPVTVENPADAGTLPRRSPGETETVLPGLPEAIIGDNILPTVGPYRLIRRLGGGGMGTVYEAEDTASGRRVALKLVQAEHAASPDVIERFRHEGELASKLVHPRCVFVLAVDEDKGQPYIVMELMTGVTLSDYVRQHGPLPPEQAIRKILDVIEGLHEAHQLGLIHRDVKPSNCFVEENGRVKIGDFGLAKSLLQEAHLTRTGTFIGTPLYASPEQIKMEAVDARSDVYSVAATLYFLLTGRAPFQTGDPMASMARIVSDEAPSMRTLRPELPKGLDKVVLRGLERDPKRRCPSLEEFQRALVSFLSAEPSVGGISLRFVAYWIDVLVLIGPNMGLSLWLNAVLNAYLASSAVAFLAGLFLDGAYYGLLEGMWGWSLGKRVVRLRVGTRAGNRPPGVGRAAWRAAVLYLLLSVGDGVAAMVDVALLPQDSDIEQSSSQEQEKRLSNRDMAIGVGYFVGLCFGLGMAACTMRQQNGFRGLHEFLSGTLTYRLRMPQAWKRRPLEAPEFYVDVQPLPGIPEQVGPYRIRGVLRWSAQEQTLLGDETTDSCARK